jgi:3-hydroxyacyl-[acyl-carrier-protein] dehydratase
MPPTPLLDLSALDLSRVVCDLDEVRKTNRQRFEMEQISGILHLDPENCRAVAFRDIRSDEWWCRGHLPDRPLFPGVLMLEAAAQASSFLITRALKTDRFIGFAGLESVRFRGIVVPPARMLIVTVGKRIDLRRSEVDFQGFVQGKMVLEGTLIGMFV